MEIVFKKRGSGICQRCRKSFDELYEATLSSEQRQTSYMLCSSCAAEFKTDIEKSKNESAPVHTAEAEAKPQTSFCRKCGAALADGSAFCSQCGFRAAESTFGDTKASPIPPKSPVQQPNAVQQRASAQQSTSQQPYQARQQYPSQQPSSAQQAAKTGKTTSSKSANRTPLILLIIVLVVFVTVTAVLVPMVYRKYKDKFHANQSYNNSQHNDDYADDDTPQSDTREHTYEVIAADVSWFEAKSECELRGGHLAAINSQEEYDEICRLANQSGLKYIWLGARIYSVSDSFDEWITGESMNFTKWYPGEPSKVDIDGAEEFFLCLWNIAYNGTDMGWTFNDQRNDLFSDESVKSGTVGYVIEYGD